MRRSWVTFPIVTACLAFLSGAAAAGGPIASGTTVAGSLAGPTFSESWTFSGTAGQRIAVAAVTTSGSVNTNITLKAPGGATEFTTSNDRVDWALAATGTYTIQIDDVGLNDAGNYAIGFLNITAGPLTGGGDVDGGAIGSAEIKTGSMSGAADFDAFTFTGSTGQRVIMTAVATGGASYNTTLFFYPPGGGAALASTFGDRIDVQLTANGTWTLVVEDAGNDTPGNYTVSLLNLSGTLTTPSDLDGGAMTSAQIKTGTMSGTGDLDAFTFSGTAGQRVIFYLVEGAGPFNGTAALYPPGGGPSEFSSSNNRLDWQLAATGTYTLVVEDAGNNDAGSYTLGFINVTGGPLTSGSDLDGGAIASAEIKTGSMSGTGDFDAFTFTGSTGQRVILTAVVTAGAMNSTLYLYPPGGGASIASTFGDRLETALNANGTWTLVIEDASGAAAGNYTTSFLNLAGPLTSASDMNGGAIASSEIKSGTMSGTGDLDAFTFSGVAGQRILFYLVEAAGPFNANAALYPPGGGAAEFSTANNRLDWPLAATGTYTLVVEDTGNNDAGSYTLGFINVTAGPLSNGTDTDGGAIASAEIKTGSMSGTGDFDAFTFTGSTGQRVILTAVVTSGAMNSTLYLYPPGGGASIASTFGDRMEAVLTANGTWTLVIEDASGAAAGNYTTSLLNLAGPLTTGSDLDGGAIASSEIKSGTMSGTGDLDGFTFSGTAGQRILFYLVEAAGPFNANAALYPPGGGAAEFSTANNRLDWQLAATGTYTLVVEDTGGNDPGSYSLGYLNVTAGPLTNGGDANGGAIASAEIKSGSMSGPSDFDAFTFTGAPGQRVIMTAVVASGTMNSTMYLYPPTGGPALASTFGDRMEALLNAAGTWTLVVEDASGAATGNYTTSLLNLAGPLTNGADMDGGAMTSSDIKAGTMSGASDLDAFTFSGTAGQRVLFYLVEAAGPFNGNAALYPPGGGAAEFSSANNRLDWQLAATGTYTLVVEDTGDNDPGSYSLGFLNVTAGPVSNGPDPDGGPITSAQVKTGTTSGPGDFDAFRFVGGKNDRVLVAAIATAGAGYNTTIYLYPPNGGAPAATTFGDRLEAPLSIGGQWTIVVEDASGATPGSYALTLLNLAGPLTSAGDPDGGSLVGGVAEMGTTSPAPDFDGFRFPGSAGDMATFNCTATSGAPYNTAVSLYPPGGGAALFTTSNDVTNFTLPTTGLYTLVVEDSGDNDTGTYTLTLTGSGTLTGVPGDGGTGAGPVALLPAAPSPFRSATRIAFRLPADQAVRLRVFDARGALVRTLVDGPRPAGEHAVEWDGRTDGGAGAGAGVGVYYVHLETPGAVSRQRVVLVR